MAQRPGPPQPPPPPPLIAAVRGLPRDQRFALAGLLAMLLGKRAPHWRSAFTAALLERVVVRILQLDQAQFEARLRLQPSTAPHATLVCTTPATSAA